MAAWLPDPIEHAPEAGWLAFLLTLAGAWWKARLRIRADSREDREAEASSDASVAAAEVNVALIEQLRSAVAAMAKDFAVLRDELHSARAERDQAIMRAFDAESKAARLTARVAALEAEVEALKRNGLPAH